MSILDLTTSEIAIKTTNLVYHNNETTKQMFGLGVVLNIKVLNYKAKPDMYKTVMTVFWANTGKIKNHFEEELGKV